MGLQSGRIGTSNNTSPNSIGLANQPTYGVVYEVLTDVSSETAKSKGLGTSVTIGCIRFRQLSDNSININNVEQLSIAYPLDKNSLTLPTRNEIVIIHSFGGNKHYSRIGGDVTPNLNANTDLISKKFNTEIKVDSSNDAGNYQNVSSTGIVRTNKNSGTSDFDGYGEYFTDNSNIHKLKLYEGDTLLESRFGQSIRFSGYNNSENKFAPTITIRNGEKDNRQFPECCRAKALAEGHVMFTDRGFACFGFVAVAGQILGAIADQQINHRHSDDNHKKQHIITGAPTMFSDIRG